MDVDVIGAAEPTGMESDLPGPDETPVRAGGQPVAGPDDADGEGIAPPHGPACGLPAGLYYLIGIERESQNMQAVSKPVAQPAEFQRLLQDLISPGSPAPPPNAVPGRLDVDKLNQLGIRPTLLRGRHEDVLQALAVHCRMPSTVAAALRAFAPTGLLLWAPQLAGDGAPATPSSSAGPAALSSACAALTASGSALEAYLVLWAPDEALLRRNQQSPCCSLLRYAHDLAVKDVVLVSKSMLGGFVPDRLLRQQPTKQHRTRFQIVSRTAQQTNADVLQPLQQWPQHSLVAASGLTTAGLSGQAYGLAGHFARSTAGAPSRSSPQEPRAILDSRSQGAALLVQQTLPDSWTMRAKQVPVSPPSSLPGLLQQLLADGYTVKLGRTLLNGIRDFWLRPAQRLQPAGPGEQLPASIQLLRHAFPEVYDRLVAAQLQRQEDEQQLQQRLAEVPQLVRDRQEQELKELQADCLAMIDAWQLDITAADVDMAAASGGSTATATSAAGAAGAAPWQQQHAAAGQGQSGAPASGAGPSGSAGSGSSSEEDLRDLRETLEGFRRAAICPVCREEFQESESHERRPVGIPCNGGIHTVCAECISGLVDHSRRSALSNAIRCPVCRQEHAAASAASWRRNVAVLAAVQQAREVQQKLEQRQQAATQARTAEQEQLARQRQAEERQRLDAMDALSAKWNFRDLRFTREALQGRAGEMQQLYDEGRKLHRRKKDQLSCQHQAMSAEEFAEWFCLKGGEQQGWKFWDVFRKPAKQHKDRVALVLAARALVTEAVKAHTQRQANQFWRAVEREKDRVRAALQPTRAYTATLDTALAQMQGQMEGCRTGGSAAWRASAAGSSGLQYVVESVSFRQPAPVWDHVHQRTRDLPAALLLNVTAPERVPGDRRHAVLSLLPQEQHNVASGSAAPVAELAACLHLGFRLPFDRELLLAQPLPRGRTLVVTTSASPGASDGGGGSSSSGGCCGRGACDSSAGHPTPSTSTTAPAGETQVYIASCSSSQPLERHSLRQVLYRRISVACFDEATRMLVLHSADQQEIKAYIFDEPYGACMERHSLRYGAVLRSGVASMHLVPRRKLLILVTTDGDLHVYDIMNNTFKPTANPPPRLPLGSSPVQLHVTPEGAMALLVYRDEPAGRWAEVTFRTCAVRNQPYLLVQAGGQLLLLPLRISVYARHQTLSALPQGGAPAAGAAAGQREAAGESALREAALANAHLEMLYYTYQKFPAGSSLGSVPACRELWIYGSRPPSASLFAASADERFSDALGGMALYCQALWAKVQQATSKSFDGVQLSFASATQWHDLAAPAPATDLGVWLLRAMCVVPLQLCRCEGNNLYPLSNGRPLQLDEEVNDIRGVAQTVSLGLYDAVFATLSSLPVYAVSSMGSQSVGKSYQLNHFGGCYFDVSGGRCTDGCWLTCRPWVTPTGARVLLVFLDFEGIGSWERTETEDMLLSLLSAALSDLTLFKTHFTWDRYTEQTCRRFNLGAPKVLAMCGPQHSGQVFRGSLVLCLKDCQSSNEQETHDTENFISNLYNSRVTLYSFPFPTEGSFYLRLDEIRDELVAEELGGGALPPRTAMQFSRLVPMLLAKLGHKDWTPLDRDQIHARVDMLREALERACRRGSLAQDGQPPDDAQLADMDTQVPVPDLEPLRVDLWEQPCWLLRAGTAAHVVLEASGPADMDIAATDDDTPDAEADGDGAASDSSASSDSSVSMAGSEIEAAQMRTATIYVPDEGLALLGSATAQPGDVQREIASLRSTYERLFPAQPLTAEQHELHRRNLNAFMAAVVARRSKRTRDWLVCNMRYFTEDPTARDLLQQHATLMAAVAQRLSLCDRACASCHLPCYLPSGHEECHTCLTDHLCTQSCHYCGIAQGQASSSAKGAVAEGSRCTGRAGHPGQHSCGSAHHTCGATCHLFSSARNCRESCCLLPGHEGEHVCDSRNHLCGAKCDLDGCPHECIMPYGQPHTVHQCAAQSCPQQCALCHRRCDHADHFHAMEPGAVHLCGEAHPCREPLTRQAKSCGAAGVCEIRSELQRSETRTFNGVHGSFEYEYLTRQTMLRHSCAKEIPPGRLAHDGACTHSETAVHFCGHPCPSCGYMCTKPHGHAGRHATQHGNMENAAFVAAQEDIDHGERRYRTGEAGIAETCDSFCATQGRGHVHVLPCDPSRCDRDGPGIVDGRRHARAAYRTGGAGAGGAPALDELTHDAYYEAINFECPCAEQQRAEFRLCGVRCGSAEHNNGGDAAPGCLLPLWHVPVTAGTVPEGVARQAGKVTEGGHYVPCVHVGEYGYYATSLIIDSSGSMSTSSARPSNPLVRGNPHFSGLDNLLGVVYEAAYNYISMRSARSTSDLVTHIGFDDRATCTFQDNNPSATVPKLQAIMRSEAALPTEKQLVLHLLGFGSAVNELFLAQLSGIGNGSYHVCRGVATQATVELVAAFGLLAEKPDRRGALLPRTV
ncbi:hypothetical protein GPECTOR_4g839 [Gonium pectorale]|uniref:RING-type domain-containing protein n=1 Tax=Gonium pectorale TaxID=33097 RepID=A0A150GY59_GONPE|nr:hypothetical protein GPECTOR_4g839 [Gonium pectorale]|eukprot:KXZ54769.1 hypothetical protein GPECTOR_4g839 [Gonium pectorale]